MKQRTGTKWIALLCMLLAVALLSGCVTKPDDTGNDSTGAATTPAACPGTSPCSPPPPQTATVDLRASQPPTPRHSAQRHQHAATIGGGLLTPCHHIGAATMIITNVPAIPSRPQSPAILKTGSTGQEVRRMQQRLKDLAPSCRRRLAPHRARPQGLQAQQAHPGRHRGAVTLNRLNSAARCARDPEAHCRPPRRRGPRSIQISTCAWDTGARSTGCRIG